MENIQEVRYVDKGHITIPWHLAFKVLGYIKSVGSKQEFPYLGIKQSPLSECKYQLVYPAQIPFFLVPH